METRRGSHIIIKFETGAEVAQSGLSTLFSSSSPFSFTLSSICLFGGWHSGDDNNNDSGSDTGSDNRKEKKPKSRKPPNTAFRQQRLLAYAPILTPKTVLPLFFAVGIIFGPIGGLLLYASSKVRLQEKRRING